MKAIGCHVCTKYVKRKLLTRDRYEIGGRSSHVHHGPRERGFHVSGLLRPHPRASRGSCGYQRCDHGRLTNHDIIKLAGNSIPRISRIVKRSIHTRLVAREATRTASVVPGKVRLARSFLVGFPLALSRNWPVYGLGRRFGLLEFRI